MSIEKFLLRILPFLFSALRQAFEKRDHGEQMAIISGVQMAQVLRNEHAKGYQAVLDEAKARMGQEPRAVATLLTELAERRGWEVTSPEQVPQYIKVRTEIMRTEETVDGFWHGVAGEVALIISGWSVQVNKEENPDHKALGWADLAAGLLEYAFRKFVYKKF
jgi:hypothetical protein